ncbi:hypothetical protein SAMN05660909_00538 [Chitinophaga terrae (ex Kim and Jung 2007)]|uniref:Uncharacterized protein n=1 Tax=Chitinophaga terrae (ex Kim and Jung 2007) TaxID=408074 RepID=A0A1H3XWJ4_9BACT|nr:hypothetical protein SAMN05660909_00538 [Chitinophaga terrae (ex Kim and Jung 2007)]
MQDIGDYTALLPRISVVFMLLVVVNFYNNREIKSNILPNK